MFKWLSAFLLITFVNYTIFAMDEQRSLVTPAIDKFQVKSGPLKTGEQVYFFYEPLTGLLIIDPVRSLTTNGYTLARFMSRCWTSVSCAVWQEYEVADWQLAVMLAIISDYNYDWQTSDAGPFTDAWWINYVSLDTNDFSLENLATQLKSMGVKSIFLMANDYPLIRVKLASGEIKEDFQKIFSNSDINLNLFKDH